MSVILARSLGMLVALGSFGLYMAAFFFPEVHRKHDFFWSGLGLFYASVLWFCAGQLSPTEAIGQIASVALLSWLGWQTLTLRRKRTPLDLQTLVTEDSWTNFRQELLSLATAFMRQTPLGRLLPPPTTTTPEEDVTDINGVRASSLKDVGYEFLDEVEFIEPLPGKSPGFPGVSAPGSRQPSDPPDRSPSVDTRASEPVNAAAGSINAGAKALQPGAKPVTLLEKAVVIKDWLVEVATSWQKPKSRKPVIDIPPRQPSPTLRLTSPPNGATDRGEVAPSRVAPTATEANPTADFFPSSQSVQIVDTQAIASDLSGDDALPSPETSMNASADASDAD
jgi:hypothetical protein